MFKCLVAKITSDKIYPSREGDKENEKQREKRRSKQKGKNQKKKITAAPVPGYQAQLAKQH